MAKEDYATAGGILKLKGAKNAGIDKKKKKKDKQKVAKSQAESNVREDNKSADQPLTKQENDSLEVNSVKKLEDEANSAHKTDAERKHEEMRRKRLDERLKREGSKTHKERVEELNKYLSNLSEHHDMPRIGPG